MKNGLLRLASVFGLVMTVMTSAAYADDAGLPRVPLDQDKISINSDQAILVRTGETPKSIKVYMAIPYHETVCVEYDERWVFGPDPYCGYETHCRYECHTVCQGGEVGHCHQECYNHCSNYMRSCYHPETYCARYGVVTETRTQSFKLKFKNASDLVAGEEELFEVKGYQPGIDSNKDKYDFKVLDSKKPYQIKKSSFLGDKIKVIGH